ncbi:MAG: aminotransferase class V-fold PLP-dependent enzyme, partial [Armatimonadetes bacterium]|nr:aminotransferase class V-fold PLP-dependent enzyme [Armatimonadota bacterium]
MDVYLDHNATSPLDPQAEAAMAVHGRDRFGNPSSLHLHGRLAREALEAARERLARALGAPSTWRLVFTSGGTEAISHALLALAFQRRGGHFVATAVEHAAVLRTLGWLESLGFTSTLVEVDADGAVDPRDVAAALRPDTVLVAVQLANNEVGTVQPVAEAAEAAHRRGVLVLVDAVQALGKLPLRVVRLGGDLWAFSGHKVGGPKGIGALLVRPGLELPPLLHGGGQEGGLRSGTENVAGAVGFSVAAERATVQQ